jgi:hypothetical protein
MAEWLERLRRNWPAVCIVVGAALLALGLSGWCGGRTGYRPYGGYFPDAARGELAVGAAVVAAGVLGRRGSA